MKKILMIAAAAAVCLASCSKNEGGVPGDRTLRITPTIGNPSLTPAAMTASTRATDTDFELGDKVGLTVTMTADGKDFVSNKLMTFDGTDFKTEGFLWYEDVNATSTLFAYYPWQEGGAAPAEFSVKADQSGDNYTASDLIVGMKAGVKPTLSSTQMTFKHKMSRIVIDVTNESGFDITSIVVKGAVGTGVLDPATGNFTAKADAEASDLIANTATANKVYYALLVPQNGVKLMVTVTTADGKKRTQTLGTADFKSGENRRMECNVQPADIEVKFTGPITGWEDGDDLLPDGEGEIEVPTVEWGGVKYEVVTLKDGRTWMAENLRYVPVGKTPSDDPKVDAGIWYPQEVVSDGAGGYKAAISKDADYIAKVGYYYDFPTAAGIDPNTINADNMNTYSGIRGICPEGWHIPTEVEFQALFSAYAESGATYCPVLAAAGFNVVFTQMHNKANSLATGSFVSVLTDNQERPQAFRAGYLLTSTAYSYTVKSDTKAITWMNRSVTFNNVSSNNKVVIAQLSNYSGRPVRCIKDKE